MNHDRASRQRTAPAHLLDLQDQVLEADRVVSVDGALQLQREDQIQIPTPAGDKRSARLGRGNLKAPIELGDIFLAQKAVGFCHGAQTPQPELLREASLPGAEVALTTSPCLWGISRDHLHAQIP